MLGYHGVSVRVRCNSNGRVNQGVRAELRRRACHMTVELPLICFTKLTVWTDYLQPGCPSAVTMTKAVDNGLDCLWFIFKPELNCRIATVQSHETAINIVASAV